MNTSRGGDPERLLSSALRAQASGNTNTATGRSGTAANVPASGSTPAGGGVGAPPPPQRLPVLRVLLFALVLGLLAGGIAGVITLL